MINLGKLTKKGKDILLEEIDNGCFKCISHCKDGDGYIRVRVNGKNTRLHRYLYEKKYGKIPDNMVIRHKCDNPGCCNINHLELGTQLDNINDMIKRNRLYKGEKPILRGTNNNANKLSEKDVLDIYLSDLSYSKLAEKYKVSKTNIYYIKKQYQWKWLTDKLNK